MTDRLLEMGEGGEPMSCLGRAGEQSRGWMGRISGLLGLGRKVDRMSAMEPRTWPLEV